MKNENQNTPLLTPEIMALMPKGLVGADATRWLINKHNELRLKVKSGELILTPNGPKTKEEYEAEQSLTTENQKRQPLIVQRFQRPTMILKQLSIFRKA